MIEDKIYVTSLSISSLIILLATIMFDEIAIGLALAIFCYPLSRYLAKKIHRKNTD
ncbi:hypothetical protein [Granulicatella seriolae]|uniref:Uncharacterized protein n=1 Tax=Granulicatella seriolae TaxID=2967226 RepID=A0ABT1WQC0_9LACT|nr:hypothetical protein [Granulicatella seriolae]